MLVLSSLPLHLLLTFHKCFIPLILSSLLEVPPPPSVPAIWLSSLEYSLCIQSFSCPKYSLPPLLFNIPLFKTAVTHKPWERGYLYKMITCQPFMFHYSCLCPLLRSLQVNEALRKFESNVSRFSAGTETPNTVLAIPGRGGPRWEEGELTSVL